MGVGPADASSEQRFEIRLAIADQAHDLAVDDLLDAQVDLFDQPPEHRMEPEDRQQQAVGERPHPVAAPHVQEFVRGDGRLLGRRELDEVGGTSTTGCRRPKVAGPDDARRHAEVRVLPHHQRGVVDGLGPRVERD